MRVVHRDVAKKLENFSISPTGCWIWKGNKTHDGYGRVRIAGKKRRAHIVSFEECFGKVPEGRMVCHKCGNRLCMNPDHLYAGTGKDNYADMVAHGNSNRPCGESHPKAKLTEDEAREIRTSPLSTRALAKIYGLGKSTIQQIKAGKIWRSI